MTTVFYEMLQLEDVNRIEIIKPETGSVKYYILYLNGIYTCPFFLDPVTMKVHTKESIR